MREKVKCIDRGHAWTVIDMELGFRICNSYQDSKYDAPSHIHDRYDTVVAPCEATTASPTYIAVIAYRQNHSSLDIAALQREVQQWK